jgi:hypothetical protein
MAFLQYRRCRTFLYNRGKCCKTLEPTAAMLDLFSNQIYKGIQENQPTSSAMAMEENLQEVEANTAIEISNYLPSIHEI